MFTNREHAGRLLAEKLQKYKESKDTLILAIPRGGVIIGYVLAQELKLPLDVVVVKKLGAPGNPELAIGAVAPEGVRVVDGPLALRAGADQKYLEQETSRKLKEIKKRLRLLRGDLKKFSLKDKTVILTDDGIATGATVEAGLRYVKKKKPKYIILAVPVAPPDTLKELKPLVDEMVVLEKPAFFGAVGQFYDEFNQVSDDLVRKLLSQ